MSETNLANKFETATDAVSTDVRSGRRCGLLLAELVGGGGGGGGGGVGGGVGGGPRTGGVSGGAGGLRGPRRERRPLEAVAVQLPLRAAAPLRALHVLVDHVLLLEDDVLALPVLHHAEGLQRADDVVRVDGHLLTDVFDGELLAAEVAEVLQQHVLPVAAVRDEPQVGQRLLWGADLALHPRQQVAEVYQQPPVALALVRRQRQYARHVVVQERVLLLTEVTNCMTAFRVTDGHYIKQEWLYVVVQCFMVKEKLCQ